MRLAIDARYLDAAASGIGTYLDNLVREMLALDGALHIAFVTRRRGLAARFDAARCSDLVFDVEPRSLRTLFLLPRRLAGQAHDVFWAPFNIMPSGLSRPAVVTIHDIMNIQNPASIDTRRWSQMSAGLFWRVRISHAVRHADAVVTVSQATKDAICEWFPDVPASKITVALSGVEPRHFADPGAQGRRLVHDALGGDPPFVLVVGNGSPHKNHHRAIEAFLLAFPAPSPMKLVLVRRSVRGDRRMQALLARDDVSRRVILLGHVSRPLLVALYRSARAFFFPSWVEGFGLPILEAMAAGCPVVTADRSAPAEVAGDAAETVNPFDVRAMAGALARVVNDAAVRARLVAAGAARARSFDWRRSARVTLDVLRRAAGMGTAPGA
jgi:glycosyltransferase involved in cell wall biosynthesis